MRKTIIEYKGYILAALLGAAAGGVFVLLVTRAIPRMISRIATGVVEGVISGIKKGGVPAKR